jgi:methylenetetrahydrofolate reductase (NADPH)
MRALRGQIGRFGRLLTDTGPDDVVRGLYAASPASTASIAGFHLFPFGGLRKSANWLHDFHSDPLAASAR